MILPPPDIDFSKWITYVPPYGDAAIRDDAPADIRKAWNKWIKKVNKNNHL